ncbi:hypothetical protein ACOZ38_25540 [Sphaerisporangium viridialbum]|uniref:hypothetical protein n=1 Tax=Sphaerisporangium viridialbum TaxID=46189 RepID=UPI003C732A8D
MRPAMAAALVLAFVVSTATFVMLLVHVIMSGVPDPVDVVAIAAACLIAVGAALAVLRNQPPSPTLAAVYEKGHKDGHADR